MPTTVSTDAEGGTLTLTYEADPKRLDGMTQAEIVDTVLFLIPALIHAATFYDLDRYGIAEALRERADVFDASPKPANLPPESFTAWGDDRPAVDLT